MSAPLIAEATGISFPRKILYALPSFGVNGAAYVVSVFVNKVYSDDLDVSLGFLSLTSFLAGVFAMYGQFGIAFSSDNWKRSKLGRRRPFFILLAPLMAMAYFLLLFPIGADTPALASAYFAVFFTLQSLLFDGLSTLYASFLNEQTSGLTVALFNAHSCADPSDRASLFGAMSVASVAGVVSGALISLALPVEDRLLVLGKSLGSSQHLVVLGGCFGAFQLISFYLLAWKGHEPRFK